MCRIVLIYLLLISCLFAEDKILNIKFSSESVPGMPYKFSMPAGFVQTSPLKLMSLANPKAEIAVQYSSEDNFLWFISNGDKEFELLKSDNSAVKGEFVNGQSDDVTKVQFKGSAIFEYHHAHEPIGEHKITDHFLKMAEAKWYVRSAFIHPLYSPAGKLVTDNFPLDHPHHKGLWFAWTNTKIDGKKVDFWNLGLKQGTVQFAGYRSVESGSVFSRICANHNWINFLAAADSRIALKEVWDLKTFSIPKGTDSAWLIDLTSTQSPQVDIHLPEYRYGGFAYRGAKEWVGDKHIVFSSEGKTKKDAHTSRGKWIAYSGKIDGSFATVAVFSHPQNFRFPEPFRVWPDKGSFLNIAPSQQGDWDLKKGEVYKWNYRLIIYDGEIDAEWLNKTWEHFSKNLEVRAL